MASMTFIQDRYLLANEEQAHSEEHFGEQENDTTHCEEHSSRSRSDQLSKQ